jgi:hypothetical protein
MWMNDTDFILKEGSKRQEAHMGQSPRGDWDTDHLN